VLIDGLHLRGGELGRLLDGLGVPGGRLGVGELTFQLGDALRCSASRRSISE
jgi:hypothetical protein